jgi:hypothetical protein
MNFNSSGLGKHKCFAELYRAIDVFVSGKGVGILLSRRTGVYATKRVSALDKFVTTIEGHSIGFGCADTYARLDNLLNEMDRLKKWGVGDGCDRILWERFVYNRFEKSPTIKHQYTDIKRRGSKTGIFCYALDITKYRKKYKKVTKTISIACSQVKASTSLQRINAPATPRNEIYNMSNSSAGGVKRINGRILSSWEVHSRLYRLYQC